jgi:branched-subunit amino acid permease
MLAVDILSMKHRIFGLLAALMFGVFVVTGVRVWVVTHQELTGSWSFFRYAIAGWILWTLGMFFLALGVASLPGSSKDV